MKRTLGLFLTLMLLMTAVSCSSPRRDGDNPLLGEWTTPYGVPPFDLIRVEHFLPAFQLTLDELEEEAQEPDQQLSITL